MKERYKWPVYGIILGLGSSFLSTFMFFKQTGVDITIKKIINNPLSLLIVLLATLVLCLVFLYIGILRDRIVSQREETEKNKKELQKEMMDQSLRLSSEINNAMEDLRKYTDQLDTIVNNIDSGICFINNESIIETGYNDTFVQIFGDRDYEGNSIINSVFGILDDKAKNGIADFLELCFTNKTASESILNDANPIREFEFVQIVEGAVIHNVISSKISIIKDSENEIIKIMFIFNDITAEHELQTELEKRDRDYAKRYSIMVALFGNDKLVIRRFIDNLEGDMKKLSVKIKEIKQNEKNTSIIEDILGIVHSIKGEAFALGFEKLSNVSGEFESFFKGIRNKTVDLENNLEIIGFFEKLNNEKREFDKTIKALEEFLSIDNINTASLPEADKELDLSRSRDNYLKHEVVSFDLLRKELNLINVSAAREMDKKSIFQLNTSLNGVNEIKYKLLKELFLHLIRNSIAHGIESPLLRLNKGKPEVGNIILNIFNEDGNTVFEYTDDGNGFDLEKIKNRALESGVVTTEKIEMMSNAEIIKIVFNDGFSTSETMDVISGTGVGMSVIKKNVFKELKGKFTLSNLPGKGIKIKITIQA